MWIRPFFHVEENKVPNKEYKKRFWCHLLLMIPQKKITFWRCSLQCTELKMSCCEVCRERTFYNFSKITLNTELPKSQKWHKRFMLLFNCKITFYCIIHSYWVLIKSDIFNLKNSISGKQRLLGTGTQLSTS